MRKCTTKKLTPQVQLMLERAEAMEREASLLRKLADTTAQLAHYKGRTLKRVRANTARSASFDA